MPAMAKYTANGTRKLDTLTYETELKRLQAELVTMQPVSYTHLTLPTSDLV